MPYGATLLSGQMPRMNRAQIVGAALMASKLKPDVWRRKRQNQQQRALPQIQALYKALHQRYPDTFFREPEKVSPLKKGIYHDIKDAFPTGTFNL